MRVFNNFIVCEEVCDSKYTSSGVYTGIQKEKPTVLRVVNIGEKVELDIKPGDVILVLKFSGLDVEINDKEFTIVKETDVIAKLEGESNE